MRKQVLAITITLVAMVLAAAGQNQPAAQSSDTTAHKRAALQKVEVAPDADGATVSITARGILAPKVSLLASPARILVSLPDTVMATSQRKISVGTGSVSAVRIGMDGQSTPTTSVVIDLAQACTYEIVPGSENQVVLKLHTSAQAKNDAKGVEAAVPAPQASAKNDAAPAKDSAKPVESANANATATPFAFIEPSYKPKDDATKDQSPAVAPPARVVEAAGKFADKSEPSLLPAPSAEMQSAPVVPTPIQPAVNLAAEQKGQSQPINTVSAPKYTGEPISVNLKDVDLKDFFRLIHEISGLNVVLDPNVKGTLTIVLDDVPWDQALDIVLKNNDLARQLDGNVLRIATVDTLRKEADARRSQQEAEALAADKVTITRFLSYAHSKDVVPTIKKFITQRGDVISDDRTNAVIISDIPSVMPGLDRLLTQLDRKTQEVEIEARVVAATRSFARDIGTQLGFGWGNNATAIGGAGAVGTSPVGTFGLFPHYTVVGTAQPTTSTLSQIPLFTNLGSTSPTSGFTLLNASKNVQIDAVLTMAESRGLLKILSRPRVVTQNNIQALVRQGVRIPIVTQAQLGGPPTVTYVDAFLRLTVIPQITSEGTIFLNVDVENTVPNFGVTIQGNPELVTQQATTQVLVTDGGTVVIGGVIQTNNSINVDQVPLLGSIPYLGNLFRHTTVSTTNQELIFFITPRIIQT